MIGILCEKPSAAQNFAKALGLKAVERSPAKYVGRYGNDDVMVVHALGHIYELYYPADNVAPEKVQRYKSWDLNLLPWDASDFLWKKKVTDRGKAIAKYLKQNLSGCDEIVLASDNDPSGEGDVLAGEIIKELKLKPKILSRMHFVDEAEKSIQSAFKTREQIHDLDSYPAYRKGIFRQRFDHLTMQFTRIALSAGDGKTLTRQGRLKSAMIVLIGDGLKALKAYKRVPYYENRFKDENGVIYAAKEGVRKTYPNPKDVPEYGKVLTSPVCLDKRERKSTPPPKLYDLSALSAVLSSLGYKPKDVLSVYQSMYEAKYVSYPRTEDKEITPEQYNELLQNKDKIALLIGIDSRLLTHTAPRRVHVKTGGSHGANRPGSNIPKSLQALESEFGPLGALIYKLLAKSALSIFAEDYVYDSEVGHLMCYPDYVGSTTVQVSPGYRAILGTDDDDEIGTKGLGVEAKSFIYEGAPTPPPTPTVKWLMKALDKRGIGTGATRTSTYADISTDTKKAAKMVGDTKGKISMTPAGELSYVLLQGTKIGDLNVTAELQEDMKEVENGSLDMRVALTKVADMVRHDKTVMLNNGVAYRNEKGFKMEQKWNGTPKEKVEIFFAPRKKTFEVSKTWGQHTFTQDELDRAAKGEHIPVEGTSKTTGRPYTAEVWLDDCEFNGHAYFGWKVGFPKK